MAQNDFHSLALSKQSDADLPIDFEVDKPSICSGADDQKYGPVDSIPWEVRAMLQARESAIWKQLEHLEATGLTSVEETTCRDHCCRNVVEPIRYTTDGAPPKRFYRTFWRAAARRVLERAREAILEQHRAKAL